MPTSRMILPQRATSLFNTSANFWDGMSSISIPTAFPVNLTELVVYPTNFACPSSVYQTLDGDHFGIADVMSPWSGAVAE